MKDRQGDDNIEAKVHGPHSGLGGLVVTQTVVAGVPLLNPGAIESPDGYLQLGECGQIAMREVVPMLVHKEIVPFPPMPASTARPPYLEFNYGQGEGDGT